MEGRGILKDASELVGRTPMIRLRRLSPDDGAIVLAKLESVNPGGSIKDRIAVAMIDDAERRGVLQKGSTIVEPTSGNTGIGLSLIAAVRGYRALIVMPDTMSVERRDLLSSFGAEIVLTPAEYGMMGAVEQAQQIVEAHRGYFMPQQFKNLANPAVHRETTGREIVEVTGGRVDAFVAGVGTGGTITGVGEALKGANPAVKVIAVEPTTSAILSGGSPGPHGIDGIGAGFIPDVLNQDILDEIIAVDDEEAYRTSRSLARQEGLLVGMSSGANVLAALKVAKRLGQGKVVATVLPDTGERYLSLRRIYEGARVFGGREERR